MTQSLVDTIVIRPAYLNPAEQVVVCLSGGHDADAMKLALRNPQQLEALKTILAEFDAQQLMALGDIVDAVIARANNGLARPTIEDRTPPSGREGGRGV